MKCEIVATGNGETRSGNEHANMFAGNTTRKILLFLIQRWCQFKSDMLDNLLVITYPIFLNGIPPSIFKESNLQNIFFNEGETMQPN